VRAAIRISQSPVRNRKIRPNVLCRRRIGSSTGCAADCSAHLEAAAEP